MWKLGPKQKNGGYAPSGYRPSCQIMCPLDDHDYDDYFMPFSRKHHYQMKQVNMIALIQLLQPLAAFNLNAMSSTQQDYSSHQSKGYRVFFDTTPGSWLLWALSTFQKGSLSQPWQGWKSHQKTTLSAPGPTPNKDLKQYGQPGYCCHVPCIGYTVLQIRKNARACA